MADFGQGTAGIYLLLREIISLRAGKAINLLYLEFMSLLTIMSSLHILQIIPFRILLANPVVTKQ